MRICNLLRLAILFVLLTPLSRAQQSGEHVESAPASLVNFRELARNQQGLPEERGEIERPQRLPRVHLKPEVIQRLHANGQPQVSTPQFSSFDSALAPQVVQALSPTPTNNFLGLDDNDTTIPPDTDGAVGPHHIVTALNSEVRITDRGG